MAGATIIFLLLLYCVIGYYCIPMKITKFYCDPNPNLCANNICNIRVVRKRLTLLNYACYHPEPLNSVEIRILIRRKTQNSNVVLFDAQEDLCNVLAANGNSMLMNRIYKYLSIYGLNLTKCPIQGNITLINCPIDASYFPKFILSGRYEVNYFSKDSIRHAPIVNYTLQFQVE